MGRFAAKESAKSEKDKRAKVVIDQKERTKKTI